MALVAACAGKSRKEVLAYFFDDVGEPLPATRVVRRNLELEIQQLQRDLAQAQRALEAAQAAAAKPKGQPGQSVPAEEAKTWGEAEALLPMQESGQVDWVEALASGSIAPRWALDADAPQKPVLDLEVDLTPVAGAAFKVVFSHRAHTEWLGCDNCHPAVFEASRGANTMSMAKIEAGEGCGACHGKVAFPIEDNCSRCHGVGAAKISGVRPEWRPSEAPRTPVEGARNWAEARKLLPLMAGGPDWSKALAEGVIAPRAGLDPAAAARPVLPLDVELVPEESAAFKAVFPHRAHTEWLGCESCHPAPFQMARGATPITMAKIQAGEYCGACHGKVAFKIEGACARCHSGFPAQPKWRPSEAPRTPVEGARSWAEASKLLPVTAGGPDWSKALAEGVIAPRAGLDPSAAARPIMPLDVELVPEGNPAFKVVFPHQAHTEWLGCESCHPALFQMARGTNPITMAKIQAGEYCGACHGKVAFPVEACGRCHAILAGAN